MFLANVTPANPPPTLTVIAPPTSAMHFSFSAHHVQTLPSAPVLPDAIPLRRFPCPNASPSARIAKQHLKYYRRKKPPTPRASSDSHSSTQIRLVSDYAPHRYRKAKCQRDNYHRNLTCKLSCNTQGATPRRQGKHRTHSCACKTPACPPISCHYHQRGDGKNKTRGDKGLNLIDPSLCPWMTAQHTPHSKPHPTHNTLTQNCLSCILRTRGVKRTKAVRIEKFHWTMIKRQCFLIHHDRQRHHSAQQTQQASAKRVRIF